MSEIDADEILEGAEGEGESKVAVNKLTWAQVGLVTEPGRYMFKFGWLTITADDLAIWQKYPRRTVVVCLVVLGSAALLEMMQLLTPDRHGPFGCDREDGRRCCRHRGWSSNPLFRASQPLVPELIRSADIKLNERISLPRAATIVSSSQLRGVSPRPSHHYRAIRGRRFAKGRRPRPSPCQPTTLRAEVIAKPSRVARS